jgi:hypothetical protein
METRGRRGREIERGDRRIEWRERGWRDKGWKDGGCRERDGLIICRNR